MPCLSKHQNSDVDGRPVTACRVRYQSTRYPSAGPIAFEPHANVATAKMSTLLRTIRARAFEVSLEGAHGFISGDLTTDTEKLAALNAVVRDGLFSSSNDYVTPHTSNPWSQMSTLVARALLPSKRCCISQNDLC